ncbi:Spy/CpxP family protein refolding chaperone [Massilia sp.]|uniref:Spy/CpxP family protein refolding chaperone n=1 Tax=Massilia sp. TaxID=1882437 RepID=UPI0028977B7F|nr:Spy/CpxP family protein refolding chaperone [Massilia sp.]
MNTLRKHLVIAFTAAGLFGAAVGAQAQSTAAPAEGRHAHAMTQEQRAAKKAEWQAKRAERHAQMQAKRAEHQARLRDALKLNAQQQPAWDAFVASMTPQKRGEGQRAGRPDRAAFAKLSAPQRMERHIAMQKQRTTRMEARLAALNNFYSVLTPEQRKTFDEQSKHRRGGRHHQHQQRAA